MAFNRKSAPKSGGRDRKITLKDAARDFVGSLINIPSKFEKVEFGDREITLVDAVYKLLNLGSLPADEDELIAELFSVLYPKGDEGALKQITFAINSFERMTGYKKNEEYKAINEKFIAKVRADILGE